MKIQCDVCNKEEAAVFCSADEAALCDGCDRRVHHANKLVSQHKRHSLLRHTLRDFPLCDICQEQRGLIFCKEDRAILCRECDLSIHESNEHVQKHSRFLLTGIKISGSSSPYRASSSSSTALHTPFSTRTKEPPSSLKNENGQATEFLSSSHAHRDDSHVTDTGSFSTSSISEYFTEMLPGWRVDDFLDSPSAPINGYRKTVDSDHGSITSGDSRWLLDVSAQLTCLPLARPECDLPNSRYAPDKDRRNTQDHRIGSEVYTVPDGSSEPLTKFRHVYYGY